LTEAIGRISCSLIACALVAACSSDAPTDPGFASDASGDVVTPVDAAPLPPLTLTVARVGQGTVTSLPNGVDCGATCTTAFPDGATVILKAVPAAGWQFGGWSDGPPTCTGMGSCAITIGGDNKKVTANFFQPKSDLTVTKVGSGTVTSTPAGINCGPTCTASFDTGSNVTLSAAPAGGFAFTGWSGACTGLGPCVVAMNGPKTATANFAISYATWDPAWSLPGVAYSNGNRNASANVPGQTHNIRTTVGKSSGKWYWEVTAIGGDGLSNEGGIGLVEFGLPNNVGYIGNGTPSGISFGYACCPQYFFTWPGASPFGTPLNAAILTGKIYMFALDMDTRRAWFGHNGSWYNSGNPSANLNAAINGLSGTVYAGVTFYSSSINAYSANFGQAAFSYGVPSGFNAGLY
jgi:hypothetical protein